MKLVFCNIKTSALVVGILAKLESARTTGHTYNLKVLVVSKHGTVVMTMFTVGVVSRHTLYSV